MARPMRAAAFRHLWAPHRLSWWIAVFFALGSIYFLVGALAATWPQTGPAALRDPITLGLVFSVGSIFFTTAAWLQALDGDMATALEDAQLPGSIWNDQFEAAEEIDVVERSCRPVRHRRAEVSEPVWRVPGRARNACSRSRPGRGSCLHLIAPAGNLLP